MKIAEHQMMSDFEHNCRMVANRAMEMISQHDRPSVIYRPKLYKDGDQWCVLYGEDIQSGVCGFGDTPSQAMFEFDTKWVSK
jgi:hypothetical protein